MWPTGVLGVEGPSGPLRWRCAPPGSGPRGTKGQPETIAPPHLREKYPRDASRKPWHDRRLNGNARVESAVSDGGNERRLPEVKRRVDRRRIWTARTAACVPQLPRSGNGVQHRWEQRSSESALYLENQNTNDVAPTPNLATESTNLRHGWSSRWVRPVFTNKKHVRGNGKAEFLPAERPDSTTRRQGRWKGADMFSRHGRKAIAPPRDLARGARSGWRAEGLRHGKTERQPRTDQSTSCHSNHDHDFHTSSAQEHNSGLPGAASALCKPSPATVFVQITAADRLGSVAPPAEV